MNKPRIVITAPKSGSGKTLITISLLKALCDKGLNVKSYKCGPDYIDPLFHKNILEVPSKNLDLFFTDQEDTKYLFYKDNTSDISVIEGVMGLYDGLGGCTQQASTYQLAQTLASPIILVIDTKGMSYSVIAEIKGFLSLDTDKLIKGVILNNISEGVYSQLKAKIEELCKVKVLGFMSHQKDIQIDSRYLGLKLPDEIIQLKEMIKKSSVLLSKGVDLDALLNIANNAPSLDYTQSKLLAYEKNIIPLTSKIRVGLAKDEAFCFYYEDNIKLLETFGIEIVEFSPIHDKSIPDNISGLILGGGYPELYAKALSSNISMISSIKAALDNNMPCLAECGGFMYLHYCIKTSDNISYPMVGAVKGECNYQSKLVRFGYITLKEKRDYFLTKDTFIKGHEFHYFDSTNNGEDCLAQKPVTLKNWDCGHINKNNWWSFAHLYYPSNPDFVKAFVDKCNDYIINKK